MVPGKQQILWYLLTNTTQIKVTNAPYLTLSSYFVLEKKNLEVLLMNYHLIRMARYCGIYMKCSSPPPSSQTRTQLLSEGYGEVTGFSLIGGLIPWWIQGLMALLGSRGGSLAGRSLRRVYMRTLLCPGPFCISFSVLPVYNEGNERLCHMTAF